MQKNEIYFFVFHSIHDVLRVEKMLDKQGIKSELVPVPRSLSSDCGVCIKLKEHAREVLLLIGDVEMKGCFLFDGKEYTPVACK